jgi:hypothetical protein
MNGRYFHQFLRFLKANLRPPALILLSRAPQVFLKTKLKIPKILQSQSPPAGLSLPRRSSFLFNLRLFFLWCVRNPVFGSLRVQIFSLPIPDHALFVEKEVTEALAGVYVCVCVCA